MILHESNCNETVYHIELEAPIPEERHYLLVDKNIRFLIERDADGREFDTVIENGLTQGFIIEENHSGNHTGTFDYIADEYDEDSELIVIRSSYTPV